MLVQLTLISSYQSGSTSLAADKFKECLNKLGDHIFVSFDIDSISSADCPVSTVDTVACNRLIVLMSLKRVLAHQRTSV